ncbi:hypothetical protein KA005_53950, partial [bacterium]|nr:hypothetical protein [bacterium]
VTINFSYEMGGGGNPPETNDWLYLDYYTSGGSWINLWSQNGDNMGHSTFDDVGLALPIDAYHVNFRFRFRSWGGFGDDFYVDDIKLLSNKNAYALIPGPTIPSQVNYYVQAKDLTGNTQTSTTYNYIAAADLQITSSNISFDPQSPHENQTGVLIEAVIYNNGGNLENAEIKFFSGNPDVNGDNIIDAGAKEIGTPVFVNFAPRSYEYVSTYWVPPIRNFYDIYVWADATNTTWEWDESNNLATVQLDVYDWLDDFFDESRIESKYNTELVNDDVTLLNNGNVIEVVGTSYYFNIGGWGYDYFAQSFVATESLISSVGIYIGGDMTPYPDMKVQLWGDS